MHTFLTCRLNSFKKKTSFGGGGGGMMASICLQQWPSARFLQRSHKPTRQGTIYIYRLNTPRRNIEKCFANKADEGTLKNVAFGKLLIAVQRQRKKVYPFIVLSHKTTSICLLFLIILCSEIKSFQVLCAVTPSPGRHPNRWRETQLYLELWSSGAARQTFIITTENMTTRRHGTTKWLNPKGFI